MSDTALEVVLDSIVGALPPIIPEDIRRTYARDITTALVDVRTDVVRMIGGRLIGLDVRMRKDHGGRWGSSWLFSWGEELYRK